MITPKNVTIPDYGQVMIIGIVRHFPVKYKFNWFCSSNDFDKGMNCYDNAAVEAAKSDDDRNLENWDFCYCSLLKRAIITAGFLNTGTCVKTELLNEVPLSASFTTRLKIPVFLWAVIGRVLWFFNSKKQKETKTASFKRARMFLSPLCSRENNQKKVLLFTHGFYINVLKKVLKELGFKYKLFFRVKHEKLYLFKK